MHTGHRERMRERFYKNGLDGFADHEVLEFILFFAIPRQDTNETAHRLIDAFGSLQAVLSAEKEELSKIEGIGANAATLLSLFSHVSRRFFTLKTQKNPALENTAIAANYIMPLLAGKRAECLCLICMDNLYRVIHTEIVSEGSVDNLPVFPREIAAAALRHNATHLILAHNHPGGVASPSRQDISMTLDIITALAPLGIQLCDHIIIAEDTYYSFAGREQNICQLADNRALLAAQGHSYKGEDE